MSRRTSPRNRAGLPRKGKPNSPAPASAPNRPAAASGPRRLPDWRLLVILALSAVLGIAFAWATPPGANPDEGAHLQYVKVIATERRLPTMDLEHRKTVGHADANYEAHQPPLYYVLAAPLYPIGNALDEMKGPYRACRLLSILIGLIGTTMVWLLAKELAPERPGLWIAATAIAAFLPMRLAVTASVSNDPLSEATGTASLLLMVRAVKGHWSRRDWIWLGVALSLALLAKQSSILLLPIALLAAIIASGERYTGKEPRPEKQLATLIHSGGVVLAVVVLLAGWYFLRNHVLYGDPLAKQVFDAYFADTPRREQFLANGFTVEAYWKKVYGVTFASFWGWFGHLQPDQANLALGAYGQGAPSRWGYPPRSWLYPILGKVLLAALAGFGVYVARRLLQAREPASAPVGVGAGVGLLTLHAIFVFGAFLNFSATYFQAQGRYLFPAIGAIALAIAAGLLEWARTGALIGARNDHERGPGRARCWETAAGWGIAAAALTLACYAYFGVLVPGFTHS